MRILILLRGFDSLKKHEVGNFELDQAKALAAPSPAGRLL